MLKIPISILIFIILYISKFSFHIFSICQNNIDCTWTVVAPTKERIELDFQFFKLEQSPRCSNDFVAIHEGPSAAAPLYRKYCGGSKPPVYRSKTNYASVRMKTNRRDTSGGFVILYRRVAATVPVTGIMNTLFDAKKYLLMGLSVRVSVSLSVGLCIRHARHLPKEINLN